MINCGHDVPPCTCITPSAPLTAIFLMVTCLHGLASKTTPTASVPGETGGLNCQGATVKSAAMRFENDTE